MNKQELRDKIVKEEIKKKWHTAENLPKYFGIDMIVVDYRKTRPHITLERYDADLKDWFKSHPAAIWGYVYNFLPNFFWR